MLLGDAVLSSHPLSSLGIEPSFGSAAALEIEEIGASPKYVASAGAGPQYEVVIATESE